MDINYEFAKNIIRHGFESLNAMLDKHNPALREEHGELAQLDFIKFSEEKRSTGGHDVSITISFDFMDEIVEEPVHAEVEIEADELMFVPEYVAGLVYGKMLAEEGVL